LKNALNAATKHSIPLKLLVALLVCTVELLPLEGVVCDIAASRDEGGRDPVTREHGLAGVDVSNPVPSSKERIVQRVSAVVIVILDVVEFHALLAVCDRRKVPREKASATRIIQRVVGRCELEEA